MEIVIFDRQEGFECQSADARPRSIKSIISLFLGIFAGLLLWATECRLKDQDLLKIQRE